MVQRFLSVVSVADRLPRSPLLIGVLTAGLLLGCAIPGAAQMDERSELLEPHPALPQIPLHVPEAEDPALDPAVEAMRARDWAEAIDRIDEVIAEDADHLEAHYYQGIAYRERAKLRTVLSRLFDNWEKGIRSFHRVIERDSSYRDVLYQLALYSRVQNRLEDLRGLDENVDYRDAIELQEAQVRHKPGQPVHLFHLFTFYRRFLNHTDLEEAREWLRGRPHPMSEFARAEALRREGRLTAADERLAELVSETGSALPAQPILLARARIHYAREDPEQAQTHFFAAVERIDGPIEAAFVMEDVKYVITPEELRTYRTANGPSNYRKFFRSVWARRDPTPARAVNVRLREHYERLMVAEQKYVFDGLRLWRNNPDKLDRLEFPAPYHLNHEFNDKGLVYIRHGEPDDRVVTLEGAGRMDSFRGYLGSQSSLPMGKQQSPLASWHPNESWRYSYRELDFHFLIAEGGTGNNWRLTPSITNLSLLEDREHWGGVYVRMTRAAQEALEAANESGSAPSSSVLDFSQDRDRMASESAEDVRIGFRTDRYTWPEDVSVIDFSHLYAAFRGSNGRTDLVLSYAVRPDDLPEERREETDTLQIETGAAVHGPDWEEHFRERSVRSLANRPIRRLHTISAVPDSYRVSFHARTLDGRMQGAYQGRIQVPAYTAGTLGMSDPVPAYAVDPTGEKGALRRSGHGVRVNPSAAFSRDESLLVFFELYDLALDENDETAYRVSYRLAEEGDEPGFFGRLFGADEPHTVTLETERTGSNPSPAEYAELDVQEAPPGTYELTVTVRDLVGAQTVERSRSVTLLEP